MGRRSDSLRKTVIRGCMLAMLLFLSAFLTINLLHLILPRDSSPSEVVILDDYPPEAVASPLVHSPPVRLEVAKLSVDAPVISVGIAQDNTMEAPKDMAETGWYKLGPKPGEKGSAVIAGHYGWDNGQGAVFNQLHTLQAGDKITVYDEKGLALDFIVRESRRYNRDADAAEVFSSNDGKAHLNLITCDGSWDNSHQTYSDRLVVFSDLEG